MQENSYSTIFVMYLNEVSDNLYQKIMQKLKSSFSLRSIRINTVTIIKF